ncbi:hypothetical protein BJ978_000326 [Agromyces terreus]|uniref:DUF4127 family protein n=1 Tax=Agromyces terreus TaxID=424795 RepID=A0A9X2GYR0_9MICO|nr:DUF4127 family protein [Agromyces terreus]MCP2369650.1 hypothetical protein [Agromyces terreus]
MSGSLRIAVVPLDDRPVNTRLLSDVAAAAGVTVLTPPPGIIRGKDQTSVDPRLADWLEHVADDADALIVNLNQLVFGGYVASRRFIEPIEQLLPRLDVLRAIRRRRPGLPIHAFVTLMRTKDVNDGSAEPAYWEQHGADIAQHSGAAYAAEHGAPWRPETVVPAPHLSDFYLRRLRLHALQLSAIEAVIDGTVTQFVVAVEDSKVESVSTSEREWLEAWTRRLGVEDRVRCYPGADEVAVALLAGVISTRRGAPTRMRLIVDDPDGLARVAAFEDVALSDTLAHQCRTAGIEIVDTDEDFVLALSTPSSDPWDWYRHARQERRAPSSGDEAFADAIRHELDAGRRVVVADVAHANGGNPALIRTLIDDGLLERLSGYAGWNTAGNTLGTALASGVALTAPTADPRAQERLLAHRIIEDVGYQSLTRRAELSARLAPDAADRRTFELGLGEELGRFALGLGAIGRRWRLAGGNARLPWDRLFEVDFELEPIILEETR